MKKRFIVACKQINRRNTNPGNAKEHYQSFIRNKNTKSAKQLETITCQSKTFEHPKVIHIKLFITEHPNTLHKLSQTIS